jgi:plastocyanin
MRAAAVVAALLAAMVAAAGAARAQHGTAPPGQEMAPPTETPVSMTFAVYEPPQIDVLAGDTVRWMNDSARNHTVTADDGTFDSGRIVSQAAFAHRYETAGSFPYHCTLHAGMAGEVDAHALLLAPPLHPAGSGRPFPLTGRAALPSGTQVRVENDTGGGFVPAGTATVTPEGTFATQVTPQSTGTYRAVAGDAASPAVQLIVLDHTVTLSVRQRGRLNEVVARVAPPSPGSDVVLQLRLRDRFGFFPVRHAKLDPASAVRFTVRLGHAVPARVRLTLPDRATALADSRTVKLGPRRR